MEKSPVLTKQKHYDGGLIINENCSLLREKYILLYQVDRWHIKNSNKIVNYYEEFYKDNVENIDTKRRKIYLEMLKLKQFSLLRNINLLNTIMTEEILQ